ncbi:MAG TPA: lysozyme inhibitor LprI family protein [Gemmatimonadales bacterium]
MRHPVSLIAIALWAPAARAQDTAAVAPACAHEETAAGARRCLNVARERKGVELAAALAGARSRAKDPAQLDTAQTTWLAFRTAQCRADASQFEGGSLQPILFLHCWLELTSARIRYLERLFREP